MKTIENDARLPDWLNAVLNSWPLCLDTDSIDTLFAVAWDEDGIYQPGSQSLFYNGYFFLRITWPGGIFLHIKLSADRRYQFGLGYKLNGRFGVTWRWGQTDAAAAVGVQGPNTGQATGWTRGTA